MNQTNILVVEDERIIAFDLKQRLEALGYRISAVVPSGEEAIEKAAELQPDLVLMDIHLEESMDGIEAAQRIHERLRILVVFLTAYAEDKKPPACPDESAFRLPGETRRARELHATI